MAVTITKEGETNRFTGTTVITPERISDKIFEGKDGMPDAIRVLCRVEDTEDHVSLFVPLNDKAKYKLQPFVPNATNIPTGQGMKSWLEENLPNEPFLVYVHNGSVRAVMAGEGKHLAQFHRLFTYTNAKGEIRARIILRTKDYKEITWTAPWAGAAEGDKAQNDIAINENKSVVQYLCKLGLDIGRLEEELRNAHANGKLYPYYDDSVGIETGGFFQGDEPSDIARALNEAIERHGRVWVQVEVVEDPKWGPGPVRSGQFKEVQLEKVVIASNPEFDKEKVRFLEGYENLTKVIHAKEGARFLVGGSFTEEGKAIALSVLKPVIYQYPDAVKDRKPNGDPAIHVPPTEETWTLNGLVCATLVAERLMQQEAKESGFLFETINLSSPDPEKLLAWVSENVPEFQGSMDEGGETL